MAKDCSMLSKFYNDKTITYWDADLERAGKDAIVRLFQALVLCNGKLLDTHLMYEPGSVPWHLQSLFSRVSIPGSAKEEFEQIAKIPLIPPPTFQVNQPSLLPVTREFARTNGLVGWNLRCNYCGNYGATWHDNQRPGWGSLALCGEHSARLKEELTRHNKVLAELRTINFENEAID